MQRRPSVRPELVEELPLVPHPTSPEPAVTALRVRIERASDELRLDYSLEGVVDAIRTEPFAQLHRADRLWEHTCFELFLRQPGSESYYELNFAISGGWAAYGFSAYRTGMQSVSLKPRLTTQRHRERLHLGISVALAELSPAFTSSPLHLAPSAVIESTAGRHSYWAAHHASAKPDFHHAAAFVVRLNAPGD